MRIPMIDWLRELNAKRKQEEREHEAHLRAALAQLHEMQRKQEAGDAK